MLNLNLNIVGAGGRSNIGAGPNIGPTTTTTTTTAPPTTSTTTTAGPISLRTDPYSASLVYAVPGAQFGSTYGQESFRSDISSYIRGTGTSFTDAELPITSSLIPTGTFTASLESVALWSGYPSAIEISGSSGSGSLAIKASSTASQFEFLSQDFTIETYINYQTANTGGYAPPNPSGPANINATMYWQYDEGAPNYGLGFNTNGIGYQDPGVRFLIITSTGAQIYYDTATLPRQANQWYHFGAQREGSTFTSLWSGSAVQSFTFSGNLGIGNTGSPFYIMGSGQDALKCHRYQDYRIYNGAAKYPGITSGSTYTQPLSMVIA